MQEKLTAVFHKSSYGYIGYVEELPGANTQGETLEEIRRNLATPGKLMLPVGSLSTSFPHLLSFLCAA
ncbi:MAG TPA: type II toxin-antitoxin system HicB family antitoxin [Candidatus Brocadiales bacterium]|nr:type II toxin-antitoxin system HicB family antitoxin [Candidatus Brocadiales bacterium]